MKYLITSTTASSSLLFPVKIVMLIFPLQSLMLIMVFAESMHNKYFFSSLHAFILNKDLTRFSPTRSHNESCCVCGFFYFKENKKHPTLLTYEYACDGKLKWRMLLSEITMKKFSSVRYREGTFG